MPFPSISFIRSTVPSSSNPIPASPAAEPRDIKRSQRNIEKHQKIADYFERLEAADNKRADPSATRAFILTRKALEEKKEALREAQAENPQDKNRIKELKHSEKILKIETQRLFVEGPQGLTAADMKAKRREQWKAASIEGLHTMFGARIWSGVSGISAAEVASIGEKIAIHQTMGYGPQSLFSGLLRIVTEVPQIRMNKGGKPKMPSNLAATSTFKKSYKEMNAAKTTLLEAKAALQEALDLASSDPSSENLEKLTTQQERIAHAIVNLLKFEGMYKNLCILLEKEFRGKKASAVVSTLAGMMSMGTYAIEPTGVGAVVGQKLLSFAAFLLQAIVSPSDYMDGNVDFPQKISAKKIDLSLLVKPASRNKEVADLEDDDMDTAIAAKLYDEQPQLVGGVVRAIYTHRMAELNSERLKLGKEIDSEKYGMVPMAWKSTSAQEALKQQKQQQLNDIEREFHELAIQIVLFEQHQADQLDPDGLIGKALTDAVFFCKKGISASVFNKVGEFWAQANQRISNNFNPLLVSLGLAAVGVDIVGGVMGSHVIHDGIDSFQGDGPENANAEHATIGLATAQGIGAINSGVTVGVARFNKTVHDRIDLGAPPYISKGVGVDGSAPRRAQLEEALRNGVISKGKKKKLERASDVIESSEHPEAQQPDAEELSRATERWEKFEQLKQVVNDTVQEINEKWLFPMKDDAGNPLLNHDGKQIVIDLRKTAACHRTYMPALERVAVPFKGIPRSIKKSMTFWRDVVKAKWESEKCREIVDGSRIADNELNELIGAVEEFLLQHLPPEASHSDFEGQNLEEADSIMRIDELTDAIQVPARNA